MLITVQQQKKNQERNRKILSMVSHVLEVLTGYRRHPVQVGVNFEWSKDSWTHNAFRRWELLVGRRCGANGIGDTIRLEATTVAIERNGERIVVRRFYTWEAIIAHLEAVVRAFFKFPDLGFRFVPIPQLAAATPFGSQALTPIYSFAIAFDVSESPTTHGNNSSLTQSHTGTGSNLALSAGYQVVDRNDSNPGVSSYTYNAVGMTLELGPSSSTTFFHQGLYMALAPASGAHNAVLTWNTAVGVTGEISIMLASYSGVSNSSQPNTKLDSTFSNVAGDTTVTVTTTVDNCWLVGAWGDGQNSGGTTAAGAGTTLRNNVATTGYGTIGAMDSNVAESPAGSYSLIINNANASTRWMGVMALAPFLSTWVLTASDSSAVSDTPTIEIISFVNKTDSSAVTDTISLAEVINISKTDTTTMSEPVHAVTIADTLSKTESTAVSDTPTLRVLTLINVTQTVVVTDTVSDHTFLSSPIIEVRQAVSPYGVISSIGYVQSTLGGDYLPVLGGENSIVIKFRVYNNYGRAVGIATAMNVMIEAFDGVNIHTATQSVINQSWIRVYETGFGESKGTPGLLTAYLGQDTAIGGTPPGTDVYSPEVGSDGSAGNHIRAGSDTTGVGFIEFASYAEMPDSVGFNSWAFAISAHYEWTS